MYLPGGSAPSQEERRAAVLTSLGEFVLSESSMLVPARATDLFFLGAAGGDGFGCMLQAPRALPLGQPSARRCIDTSTCGWPSLRPDASMRSSSALAGHAVCAIA